MLSRENTINFLEIRVEFEALKEFLKDAHKVNSTLKALSVFFSRAFKVRLS